MVVSRRVLLSSSIALAAIDNALGAAPSRFVDLGYRAGRLSWPGGAAPAACGRGGVRSDKREGDGASPEGRFPLLPGFYRADRIVLPPTHLAMTALQPNDAWVDDPADANYNRLVSSAYPARGEAMWRQDGLYDILVVIGYNTSPVVPGAGSAIFLHVARPDFSPTAGCIAVSREVLLTVMALLGPGSAITIRA